MSARQDLWAAKRFRAPSSDWRYARAGDVGRPQEGRRSTSGIVLSGHFGALKCDEFHPYRRGQLNEHTQALRYFADASRAGGRAPPEAEVVSSNLAARASLFSVLAVAKNASKRHAV